MKGSLQFQDFRLSTSSPSALSRAIDNPFKQFAASKMPRGRMARLQADVSYVDFLGRTHTIRCTSKAEIVKARKFFDTFREEGRAINAVLASFPRREDGTMTKKDAAAARKALKAAFRFTTAVADWLIRNA
jgi:hypothetical protein